MDGIILLIISYCAWSLLGILVYLSLTEHVDEYALSYYGPVILWIRESTGLNWFGCFIGAVAYFIAFPLLFVGADIIKLLWWLMHVGRKE